MLLTVTTSKGDHTCLSPNFMCSKDGTTRLVSARFRARFKTGSSARWASRRRTSFQIIHVLPKSQFRYTPSFLGLNYSDDLIVLEITFISGRPEETRLKLLKALNDGVVSAAGISPDDLLITLYETPGENISFGRGLAQRAHVAEQNAEAAR
jgi:Tautomerase enzyme